MPARSARRRRRCRPRSAYPALPIDPDAQAAALGPWAEGERLIVCGIAGFKDFWPAAIAASLARPGVWPTGGRVEALTVEPAGVAGRRNLSGLHLARLFDDAGWRRAGGDDRHRRRAARRPSSPDRAPGGSRARRSRGGARRRPGGPAVPRVRGPARPPSAPGVRLFNALPTALREWGGRIGVGEEVQRIERDGKRVHGRRRRRARGCPRATVPNRGRDPRHGRAGECATLGNPTISLSSSMRRLQLRATLKASSRIEMSATHCSGFPRTC